MLFRSSPDGIAIPIEKFRPWANNGKSFCLGTPLGRWLVRGPKPIPRVSQRIQAFSVIPRLLRNDCGNTFPETFSNSPSVWIWQDTCTAPTLGARHPVKTFCSTHPDRSHAHCRHTTSTRDCPSARESAEFMSEMNPSPPRWLQRSTRLPETTAPMTSQICKHRVPFFHTLNLSTSFSIWT